MNLEAKLVFLLISIYTISQVTVTYFIEPDFSRIIIIVLNVNIV